MKRLVLMISKNWELGSGSCHGVWIGWIPLEFMILSLPRSLAVVSHFVILNLIMASKVVVFTLSGFDL